MAISDNSAVANAPAKSRLTHLASLFSPKIRATRQRLCGKDDQTSARPGNEPLLIGRPDVVLLDRERKRGFLIISIDEADEGGRR
jgi:hypothetical protein